VGGTRLRAILSDVHGNLEALQAVLRDAALHGVEAVYCLGDLVGFGPSPRECVEAAMRWQVVLQGDYDHRAVFGSGDESPWARRADAWTRGQLGAAGGRPLEFLAGLRPKHREGDFLFVHASPRDPLREFVFPEEIYNRLMMERLFAAVGRYCLVGHTHVPGVFTEDFQYLTPEEVGHVYRLGGGKALVNVGSVGQPRDGDWRACYALLDGEAVRFRRVEYDVEATVRKVHGTDDLDNLQGDRLREGR